MGFEYIWLPYAVTDGNGHITGISDDSPKEAKEAYKKQKEEEEQYKRNEEMIPR